MATANIIINLGAPCELSVGAAETFLRSFLSDPNVLPLPFPFRNLLAARIAKKRAAHYLETAKKTAINGVPPIYHYTKSLAAKVSELGVENVFAAFQFGRDSLAEVVLLAREECGASRFNFIPAYPQNSRSMTQSARAAVEKCFGKRGADYKFLESYCGHSLYIEALAKSLANADGDALLASFHSVPVSQLRGSPYADECDKTASLLCEKIGRKNALVAWQSKMGRGRWLEPQTVEILGKMARRGVKRIDVVCPGFSCDCTETLVEIASDARDYFLEQGGGEFNYIPCLNDSDMHAELFAKLFEEMK